MFAQTTHKQTSRRHSFLSGLALCELLVTLPPPYHGRVSVLCIERFISSRVGSRSFTGETPSGQYNWAIVGWQVVTSGLCVRTRHDKSEIDPRLERCDRTVYTARDFLHSGKIYKRQVSRVNWCARARLTRPIIVPEQ